MVRVIQLGLLGGVTLLIWQAATAPVMADGGRWVGAVLLFFLALGFRRILKRR